MNFYQFYDLLNGKPYQNVPPPVKYSFKGYMDAVSNGSPAGNSEDADYNLKPLSFDDMARCAADDVPVHNTTRLGDPMSDEELHAHYGLSKRRPVV